MNEWMRDDGEISYSELYDSLGLYLMFIHIIWVCPVCLF